MNGMPRGFAAAQRAYENASPPDAPEVPESVIEDAKESVFDGCVAAELAGLIYEARDVLARVARGEPVGVSDAFAALIREADHLHRSVDEAIERERQRDDNIAADMQGFHHHGEGA